MAQKKFDSMRHALAELDGFVRSRVAPSEVLLHKNPPEMGLWLLDDAAPGDILSVLTTNMLTESAPLVDEMCFKFSGGGTETSDQASYAGWDMYAQYTSGGAANTKWLDQDPDINCVFRVMKVRVRENGSHVRRKVVVIVAITAIPANTEASVEYGDEFVHTSRQPFVAC